MKEIIKMNRHKKLITILFLFFSVVTLWKIGIVKLTVLGIAGLTFVMLFSMILKSNTFAIGLILTIAFSRVIFHLLSIPRAVPTLFTEFCVVLLLAKALYLQLFVNKKPLKAVGFFPMMGVVIVIYVSYVINEPDLLPAIFFMRQVFIYYLFFVALQNLNLSIKTVNTLNRYLIFLFLIQIPAALVKYILIGQSEAWVGTVSWQAGQLSTMLPLFAISFLFAFYFFRKKRKYLLLVAGFLFFGIAGQKRALALLVPVLAVGIWYLYGKQKGFRKRFRFNVVKLKYLFIICIIGYLSILGASRFLKDEMYDGRLDIYKLVKYVEWYNTRDDISLYGSQNTNYSMGRLTIMVKALNKLISSDLTNKLIGFGPGTMIHSHHLGREDSVFERYRFRGATPGVIVFVLQVGFLGTAFLTYFLFQLFRRSYITYYTSYNSDSKIMALGFMGVTFVFLFDFFFYSQSTLFFGILTPAYFYIANIVCQYHDKNVRFFSPYVKSIGFPFESAKVI